MLGDNEEEVLVSCWGAAISHQASNVSLNNGGSPVLPYKLDDSQNTKGRGRKYR